MNKCEECGRRLMSVRTIIVDGKIRWVCDVCYKELKDAA